MTSRNTNINWPGDKDRFSIVGTTGSGKTQAALYNLSRRNYDVKPWIIYDFKHEELISAIDGAQHISMGDKLPHHPGIYVTHPLPGEEEIVDEHMMRIWQQGNIGVYIDEGYMLGQRNIGFRYLLTQGRSLRIPMIINSQRPVWMDRFVFSESQFFQVFRLQHTDDIKSAQKFIPYDLESAMHGTESERLPVFYSIYYDVKANRISTLSPVPDADAILDTFDTRMPRIQKVI
jgi:hypothetical protein